MGIADSGTISGGGGALVRRLRVRAGLSQKELAQRAGLSVRTLRYLESGGVARPQAASLRRLADALGVEPQELADRRPGASAARAGLQHSAAGRGIDADPADPDPLRIEVLGSLVVRHGEQVTEVRSAMQRTVLGLLALQHGHLIGSAQIVDLLWPDEPPRTCLQLVHTYVGQVRRLLEPGPATRVSERIRRRGGGYVLEVETREFDLAEFDHCVAQGRQAWAAGSALSAAQFYREAWACWRGPLLAGLDARLREHPAAVAIAHRRIAAVLEWADIAFSLARYAEVAGALRVLHAQEPLHEALAARLMLALAGNGEQAAALDLFDEVRGRLDARLGVTPGPELRAAQLRVLRGQLPAAATQATTAPTATLRALSPPAQLPADIDAFIGRGAQLDTLDALLPAADAGSARVVVVAGMGGVGKTALALHWAHRVRRRFPDGQLYVDLRGHSGEPPLRSLDALTGFLLSLGVPAEQIPADEAQAAAIYRSRLAGKRILLLADNAGSADQVRPLLPSGPGSLALVTCRDRLTGLIAREGARLVPLGALAAHESTALLDHMLGPRRAAAEAEAVGELARLCTHLPLALRIAAANITARPRHRVADYNRLLGGDRLGALEADGDAASALRATFELSCNALPSAQRRMFRLLGIAPGPDISVAAAAALAGITPVEADSVLGRLTGRHLVDDRAADRYTMHDLLRLYAAELAEAECSAGERDSALTSLAAYYRAHVAAAARLHSPHLLYLPARDAPGSGTEAEASTEPVAPGAPFEDIATALAWLDAERPNLVALVRELATRGHRVAAWEISDLLSGYFLRRGTTVEWRVVAEQAHAAALADADPAARAATELQLAMVDLYQGRFESSAARHAATAQFAELAGWTQCQAVALNNLARCQWTLGLVDEPVATLSAALELHRRVGRVAGEAVTLANLGAEHADRGKEPNPGPRERESLKQAVRFLNEALALHRRIGDRRNEGDTLRVLAEVHRDMGDLASATRKAEQALELARAYEDVRFEIGALSVLGTTRVHRGEGEHGLEELSRALELATQIDDPRAKAETHLALADAHANLAAFDEALLHAEDACDLARQMRSGMLERQCRRAVANIEAIQPFVAGSVGKST